MLVEQLDAVDRGWCWAGRGRPVQLHRFGRAGRPVGVGRAPAGPPAGAARRDPRLRRADRLRADRPAADRVRLADADRPGRSPTTTRTGWPGCPRSRPATASPATSRTSSRCGSASPARAGGAAGRRSGPAANSRPGPPSCSPPRTRTGRRRLSRYVRMLTALGEAIVDLVAEGDRRFVAHPGGSPLNVAVGLGRLGQPVSLAARLSRDPFGPLFRAHLAASGVDPRHLVDAAEPSTLAVATVDADGVAATTSGPPAPPTGSGPSRAGRRGRRRPGRAAHRLARAGAGARRGAGSSTCWPGRRRRPYDDQLRPERTDGQGSGRSRPAGPRSSGWSGWPTWSR